MAININTVNMRQAKSLCLKAFAADLPIMLRSSPGVGKSSLAREIADEFNLEFVDIRLATHDVTDLTGLPKVSGPRAEFLPFNIFPLEGDSLPKGKKGWLVLLDEITSCSRSMQAASYRLLLDREVGQYKLHPACVLMAAGNNAEDNAVVNELSTALKSRLITLRINVDPEQWVEDYAIPHGIDRRIIGYIKANPNALNDFDPESDMDTYAVPRTWEFLSKIFKDKPIEKEDIPLIAGTIGDSRAGEFYAACNILSSCKVTIEDILKDPFLCEMPRNLKGERDTTLDWLFVTSLVRYLNKKRLDAELISEVNQKESKGSTEFKNIMHYINRFDEPLRVVFCRMVVKNLPDILGSKFFRDDFGKTTAAIRELLS